MEWIATLDWTTIAIATIISAVISSMATLWVNRKSREKYKNDLEKSSLRYQRMYDKRIDIIYELYRKMVAIEKLGATFYLPNIKQLKKITEGGGSTTSHEAAKKPLMKLFEELDTYISENALYFDEGVAKHIKDFGWGYIAKAHQSELGEYGSDKDIVAKIDNIPKLKRAIEADFRKILDGEKR